MTPRLGLNEAISYGPVAGRGTRAWRGVPAGTAYAEGSASLAGKSGSGAVRWKVTVFEAGSVTIPRERSHGLFGAARHLRAPTMPA